jgi:hypothetical protein
MPEIKCRSCDIDGLPDYKALALHIIQNKKTHKKGRLWALRYMSKQQILDRKISMKSKDFAPATEDEVEIRETTRRDLSGRAEYVKTICLQGKHPVQQHLPVEYTESAEAWRIQGLLVVTCDSHRR